MNTFTICESLAAYLKTYTALNTYSDQKFAKRPHLFIGFDGRNAPADTFLPYIAVVPSTRQDVESTHEEHTILLAVVCTDDSNTTASGVTKYEGFKTISDFEARVFEGVQAYFNEQIIEQSMLSWAQAQYNGYWPEYHATREITVTSAKET